MPLGSILEKHDISQARLAAGTARSPALISRLVSGEVKPSHDTARAVLTFLRDVTGEYITYEEAFGDPAAIDMPVATVAPGPDAA